MNLYKMDAESSIPVLCFNESLKAAPPPPIPIFPIRLTPLDMRFLCACRSDNPVSSTKKNMKEYICLLINLLLFVIVIFPLS